MAALTALLEPFRVTRPEGARADRAHGMQAREIKRLCEVICAGGCKAILEIGMASGSSTVAMLETLKANGGGHITSIDPFQFADDPALGDSYYGIRGAGVRNVAAAGLASMHTLISEFDYVALPRLAAEGARYDLVLIDGYHSFELTFLDFLYADMMLELGGICLFHDSGAPAVHKVLRFLMCNKAYVTIGPAPAMAYKSLIRRTLRRFGYLVSGRGADFRERRLNWGSLAAFRKAANVTAPEFTIAEF